MIKGKNEQAIDLSGTVEFGIIIYILNYYSSNDLSSHLQTTQRTWYVFVKQYEL